MALTKKLNVEYIKNTINETKKIYDLAQEKLKSGITDNDSYSKCLEKTNEMIKILDDANPFEINRLKEEVKTIYLISADILIRHVGIQMNRPNGLSENEKGILFIAISHLQKVFGVDPFNTLAKELYKIIIIYITIFNSDLNENLKLLKSVLMIHPCDYQLQFNLGFVYQRLNDLENSLTHYKMAYNLLETDIKLNEYKLNELTDKKEKKQIEDIIVSLKQFLVKCLNGLGSIYFTIQDRELANYYFYKAIEILPDDPDIHNQIGVTYTELRLTDKAIYHYKKGIENYKKAHISVDLDMLLASMYMNMGLAYCYEINYPEAIECYNKSLKYKPNLSLAYQNKLLDLNYISHLIEDPMYIFKSHKNINKIYEKVINDYRVGCPNYKVNEIILKCKMIRNKIEKKSLLKKTKLNIGFVSGDFICHPVSYFIHCILKYINYDLFNVHCFSLKLVSIKDQFPEINWHLVKGKNPEELKKIIQEVDNNKGIDILFDLSSQTGDNRLDTFVLKPAPIQISYCGYPNTSGLSNMDYHIVDHYTDSDGKTPGPGGKVRPSTQKYYTEKLLFMKKCFLNYIPPIGIENLPPLIDTQPAIKNKYLTIGTFNRYNKINDMLVNIWEKILERCPDVRFIIKTKEFLTEKLKQQFIDTWKDKEIFKRVTILDYSDTYLDHLPDYNLMDIALDTFPYSGTTTSAEALMMGTPIITLFDEERQYHPQNVTSSFMANSDLEEFICYSQEEYINKVKYYSENLDKLKNLKQTVRNKFVNGNVCNYKTFVGEFEDLLLETYRKHNW